MEMIDNPSNIPDNLFVLDEELFYQFRFINCQNFRHWSST